MTAANRVVEFARPQRTLRAFGRGAAGHRPLDDAITAQHTVGRRAMWMSVPGILAGGFATQLAFTVLIVTGVLLALQGTVDAVALVAVLALAARFTGPLAELSALAGAVRMAHNDVRRIAAVLDEQPLAESAERVEPPRPGEIALAGVRFGYTKDRTVLQDVSFTVPARTMTGLVGASGSGKTTVTRLIARFWDVDAGAIRVGGADVRDQRTEDLMAQIAMVFQDVYLFDDTLGGEHPRRTSDATDAEVLEAGRLAGVTRSWRGCRKAGRPGSARAVRRCPAASGSGSRSPAPSSRTRPSCCSTRPPPRSTPRTSAYVREAMRTLMTRSTLLVIAHRLPTVVAADQIVVLDDGGVAETGTHAELLAADGRCAAFWRERDRAQGWRLTG